MDRLSKKYRLWPHNQSREISIARNSRSQLFFKIGILKNFAILTGKHLCWSLSLRPVTLLKKNSNAGLFL